MSFPQSAVQRRRRESDDLNDCQIPDAPALRLTCGNDKTTTSRFLHLIRTKINVAYYNLNP